MLLVRITVHPSIRHHAAHKADCHIRGCESLISRNMLFQHNKQNDRAIRYLAITRPSRHAIHRPLRRIASANRLGMECYGSLIAHETAKLETGIVQQHVVLDLARYASEVYGRYDSLLFFASIIQTV
jgi:hypothetical protein